MSDTMESEINLYINHFNKQIEEIDMIESTSSRLYKKILYITVLDSLSRVIYPKENKHKNRFINFVRDHSDWKESEKISFTHLLQWSKSLDPYYYGVFNYVQKLYKESKVLTGAVIGIEDDPSYEDILELLPLNIQNKSAFDTISRNLESIKHVSLLYDYRNYLVHEFRTPGYGMDLTIDDRPCYHLLSEEFTESGTLIPSSIELIYPLKFFKKICRASLENIKKYLIRNSLDPYKSYKFGTYFYPKLNK